jgi:hypothetical protein
VKRIEGPKNYCDGCNDYVYPEGAPVVQVVEGGGDYEYPQEPIHLCFRCAKAALDELTRPNDPCTDSPEVK